jgi:hypothetical protein
MDISTDNATSAADFIQAARILKIVSPLGEDQLLAERVTIEEGVSSLFEIRLYARTKKLQIKPEELIGRLIDVSIEVQQGDGEDGSAVRRPFNGLVTELNEGPPITRGLRSYAMVLRPQMWLLSRRSDCRIWMDKTSIEICETLFSEHGIPAPDMAGVITPPHHSTIVYSGMRRTSPSSLAASKRTGCFTGSATRTGNISCMWPTARRAGSRRLRRRKERVGFGLRRARPTAITSTNGPVAFLTYRASAPGPTGILRRRAWCRAR